MSDRRKFSVIVNSTAGQARGKIFDQVIGQLAARDCAVDIHETAKRGDAQDIAYALSQQYADVIIAAGGDGTINEVMSGLRPGSPPLGIIPIGTANVLALEIGLSVSANKIVETLLVGNAIECVLGEVNGLSFVQMTSVGFDAEIVSQVNSSLKEKIGKSAYLLASLKSLTDYQSPEFDLSIDGKAYTASAVIVANGRLYAGRYVCAPKADIAASKFEVCLLTEPGRLNVLRYALALYRNKLSITKGVEILSATEIEIHSPIDRPVQADGDPIARTPAKMTISPRRVKLIVPN